MNINKIFNRYILSKIDKISFYLGFMKAYNVPILPKKIESVYSNIYVRILRFIGGVCLLLILTNKHLLLPIYLHKVIIVVGAIQSVQILIVFIIKVIYGLYTLLYKPKDFEVRNSPLNQYATHLARILYCAKWGCAITGSAAGTIAAGASFDLVLEAAGREKVFIPMVGSMYKSVFGELPRNQVVDAINNTKSDVKSDVSVSEMVKKYESMNDNEKLVFLAEINREIKKI